MIEIPFEGTYRTEIKGSAPARGNQGVLTDYIEGRIDKTVLTFAQREMKKSEKIPDFITEILSLFHRNEKGELCIGNWQQNRCFIDTGSIFFNAIKNKTHPPKTMVPNIIRFVEPDMIPIRTADGKTIKDLTKVGGYVDTCLITKKEGNKTKSFFKAYETLPAGMHFQCKVYFDEEFISEELAKWWIEKSGAIGNYAWRERFGKYNVSFNGDKSR